MSEINFEKIEVKINKFNAFKTCKIVDKKLINSEKTSNKLEEKLFKCVWPQCKYKTNLKKNLKSHVLIHTKETKLICDFENCNQVFK